MRPSNIATLLWRSLLLLGNWRFQNIGSANHVDSGFHPMFGLTELFSLKDLLISFQLWKIEFCFWLFEGDVEEVYETSKKLVDNPRLELMKVSSHTKHFTQFLLLF